jgi:hypothetical protein
MTTARACHGMTEQRVFCHSGPPCKGRNLSEETVAERPLRALGAPDSAACLVMLEASFWIAHQSRETLAG